MEDSELRPFFLCQNDKHKMRHRGWKDWDFYLVANMFKCCKYDQDATNLN